MKNIDGFFVSVIIGLVISFILIFYGAYKSYELEHMYIQHGYEQGTIPGVSHLVWKKSCTE
jgi:hypothetical protein